MRTKDAMQLQRHELPFLGVVLILAVDSYRAYVDQGSQYLFWLAPLLLALCGVFVLLVFRLPSLKVSNQFSFFLVLVILVSSIFLGALDLRFAFYLMFYAGLLGLAAVWVVEGEVFHMPTQHGSRAILLLWGLMLYFLLAQYFTSVIWNWGSEHGENTARALQTLLAGRNPYGRTISIEHVDWCLGAQVTYDYLPAMLLYYLPFNLLPVSAVPAGVVDFSSLKVANLFAYFGIAFLLFKAFKDRGESALGLFGAGLALFLLKPDAGGTSTHYPTAFFITLSAYLLIAKRYNLVLPILAFTALLEPFGTLFAALVMVHTVRRFKNSILVRGLPYLGLFLAALLPFLVTNLNGLMFSVFEFNMDLFTNLGTYYLRESVANFAYFVYFAVNGMDLVDYYYLRLIVTILVGAILMVRYTRTPEITLVAALGYLLLWMFFTNGFFHALYFQVLIGLVLLLGSSLRYGPWCGRLTTRNDSEELLNGKEGYLC